MYSFKASDNSVIIVSNWRKNKTKLRERDRERERERERESEIKDSLKNNLSSITLVSKNIRILYVF